MFSRWDCDANKRCYIQIFIENAFYYHILSQQELRGSTLEPDNLSTSIHQTSFWYYYHMKLKTPVDKSVKILCLNTALYNSIYQACYLYNWPVNILIITKFSIYFLSCSDNLYYTFVMGHIRAGVPYNPCYPLHPRVVRITTNSQVIYKDISGNTNPAN